jgi:hypothetical protein
MSHCKSKALGCRYAILLALFLCCSVAYAQVTTGDILGTITDSSGAVIAGAKIVITNKGTHETHTLTSNGSGQYILSAMPNGTYSLTVTVSGFKSAVVDALKLDAGSRLRQDFTMVLGQNSESVQVTGTPPALETDNATLSSVVNERQVQDLPLNGRNFIQLAQLAAGANEGPANALSNGTRPDDRRQTSSVSVYAQSDTLNNELVDGIDNNEKTVGTLGVRPSIEAISEFRVSTNMYPAEVGKTAGAVVNLITKSGTNDFHGSVFEFLRNDVFDARNFFARQGSKPEYRQNQFGGSVGGPIQKDKTFFFGDYEGLRIIQGTTYVSTVPTLFEEQNIGNFSDIGGPILTPGQLNPIALNYFALYPAPTSSGTSNNFTYSPNRTQNSDTFDARVDRSFSDRNRFFARYSFNNVSTYTPDALPVVNGISPGGSAASFPGNGHDKTQQLALSDTHLFSSNTILELLAGYTRINLTSLPVNYGKNLGIQFGIINSNIDAFTADLPTVSITGYSGFGNSGSLPLTWLDNNFQYGGALTHTRGNHTFKVGAQLVRRQIYNQQNGAGSGSFSFNTNPTKYVLANFLQGTPYTVSRSVLLTPFYFRTWEPSVYAQDDWRVKSWLTLNLGIRYDIFTPMTDASGSMSTFDPTTAAVLIAGQNGVSSTANVSTDYKSVAPRVGFSASLNRNTVLRGGYGIIYYRDNTGALVPFLNPPNNTSYAPNPLTVNFSTPLPLPTGVSASSSLYAIQPDYRNSSVQQMNLNFQRNFSGTVVTLGYVGELTRHERIAYNLNLASPSPEPFATRRPYYSVLPKITGIFEIAAEGYTNYNGFLATAEHRLSHGLTANLNYTWSHAIGDFQSYSNGGTYYSAIAAQTATLERGNSDLDVRHHIALLLNYALPFGQNLTGFNGVLGKGWQFNAIDVWGTGSPFTVGNSSPLSNTGVNTDRPNQIASYGVPDPTITRWFNTNAFEPQALGTIGTERRNALYGPTYRHFDCSVGKDFPIRERLALHARAEAFNLTNTPNFNAPAATFGTSSFGTISSVRPGSTPRDFQFALRLSF